MIPIHHVCNTAYRDVWNERGGLGEGLKSTSWAYSVCCYSLKRHTRAYWRLFLRRCEQRVSLCGVLLNVRGDAVEELEELFRTLFGDFRSGGSRTRSARAAALLSL